MNLIDGPDNRRNDPDDDSGDLASGCAIALLVGVFLWAVSLAVFFVAQWVAK